MITNIYVYRWWLRFKIVLLKNSNYCLHIRFITSASNQFKYFTTSWFQSWSFIKKNLVSNKDSLQNQLKNFQADKCDSASARKAKDLIGDVTLEKARNVSKAASSLVAWVRKVFVLWLLFFFFGGKLQGFFYSLTLPSNISIESMLLSLLYQIISRWHNDDGYQYCCNVVICGCRDNWFILIFSVTKSIERRRGSRKASEYYLKFASGQSLVLNYKLNINKTQFVDSLFQKPIV